MAKNPSSVWYWNDWVVDPAVRACSMAAQGMWMQMLAIAAAADGYVRVGVKPCSISRLAEITGQDRRSVGRWVDELERKGVFSRTEDGTIFCRRMVRETETRAAKRADPGARSRQKSARSVRKVDGINQPDLLGNQTPKTGKCAPPYSDSDSVAVSQTHPPNCKPLPESLNAARATEAQEGARDENEREVSQQRCALSKEATEARSKRKNQILSLRRWSQHSPHLPDDEREHRLEMLARATEALESDAWNSRTDEDRRCYDALARKAERLPLDDQTLGWIRMAERPDKGGLWRRSKVGANELMARELKTWTQTFARLEGAA